MIDGTVPKSSINAEPEHERCIGPKVGRSPSDADPGPGDFDDSSSLEVFLVMIHRLVEMCT